MLEQEGEKGATGVKEEDGWGGTYPKLKDIQFPDRHNLYFERGARPARKPICQGVVIHIDSYY